MKKKWLITLPLLLGVAGAWAGDQTPPHKIEPGETLGKIAQQYGQNWKTLCAYNSLANCDVIQVNALIRFPTRNTVVEVKKAQACVTLNTAPWNRYRSHERRIQAIDANPGLTQEEKAEAKALVTAGRGERRMVKGDMVFKAMPFRSKNGGIKFLHDVRVCTPEQGGRPEAMETWRLSTGKMLADMLSCGNITYTETAIVPQPPPVESLPLPSEPPASTLVIPGVPTPQLVVEPPEAVTVARDYDFDGIVWAGGDKHVRHVGTTDAGYPVINHYDWGRYGLGGGGTLSAWHGGTPDGFRFSGLHPAFGVAQKFSFVSRRSVSVKVPMYSDLWTKGHDGSGRYQQKAHAKMWCAALDYTDASREKAGATWFPEFSISTSYCDPFSQTASHSYDGKELATPPAGIDYVAGASVEVIIRKNFGDDGLASRWQPTAELGWNKTSPNPISGHAYLGARSTDKLWSVGVGQNRSSLGKTLGGIVKYNWGRAWVLNVQRERWNAMLQSLKDAGATFEEDGTVVVPIP